ncbi:MAG TPA: hypothetical protein VMH86_10835 [Rhizomicrobium sp.]|nr:hypothetical protein [Rhizomicrobium sp.]
MRGLFVIALAFALCACSVWPVNQDPYGMGLRRDADRVLRAVEAYQHENRALPASLAALVPKYLPAIPDLPHMEYTPADGSLAYRYIPSWPQLRPVWCHSVGDSTDWQCAEHLI